MNSGVHIKHYKFKKSSLKFRFSQEKSKKQSGNSNYPTRILYLLISVSPIYLFFNVKQTPNNPQLFRKEDCKVKMRSTISIGTTCSSLFLKKDCEKTRKRTLEAQQSAVVAISPRRSEIVFYLFMEIEN